MKKTINVYMKTSHWLALILVLFLAITGIAGCTVFHYSTLIPNLEFAYGVNEIQSGRASQVFIARIIRGLMWDWHFYAGCALTILTIIGSLFSFRNYSFKKNPFMVVFLLLVIVLFITGWIRYYRGELSFTTEQDKTWRNLARAIHHYGAYAMGLSSLLHVVHMIVLNSKKYKGIISNMFTSSNFMLRSISFFLTCSIVLAVSATSAYSETIVISKRIKKPLENDIVYKKGMEYYSGEKGFVIEQRTFPNCPYDACDQPTDDVSFTMKEGVKYYNIKIHNFKKAKEFFDASVEKTKNPLAAEKNIIMITERINYKDKIFDEYLLKHVEESLGINGQEAISNEIRKNINLIGSKNSIKILYRVGLIFEHGYFGIEPNIAKAKSIYKIINIKEEKSANKSLYYALAKARLRKLSIMGGNYN